MPSRSVKCCLHSELLYSFLYETCGINTVEVTMWTSALHSQRLRLSPSFGTLLITSMNFDSRLKDLSFVCSTVPKTESTSAGWWHCVSGRSLKAAHKALTSRAFLIIQVEHKSL